MSDFLRPGMLVECVDDRNFRIKTSGDPFVVRGHIYTIRRVTCEFSEPAVTLREVPETYEAGGAIYQGWYAARRFRPLGRERLETFRQYLRPLPARKAGVGA